MRSTNSLMQSFNYGAELVEAAGRSHVRLLADIYHMSRENEPASEIRRFGHLIQHVHIAEKEQRTPPGVKGDDFRPYFQALRDVNYAGALSIESRFNNLAAEAKTAFDTLKGQLC